MEFLVLIAILIGPFLGIWANDKLGERKQAKERKLDIFKTLMATRATPLSPEYVRALNRIDMEFVGGKDDKVQRAWNALLTHFGEGPNPPNLPATDASEVERKKHEKEYQTFEIAFVQWSKDTDDLRTKLLKEMGARLGYDFDDVHIRKAAYNPKLHGDIEMTQRSFLEAANEVFTWKRSLPMFIVNWPGQQSGDDD